MADTKISALAAVTDVQTSDDFVLARAGATKRITGADLASEIGASAIGAPWNQQFSCGLGFTQVAGATSLTVNSSFAGNCSAQSDGNNGTEMSWPVTLDAGTYTFILIAQTSSNRSIHSLRLDGTQFDSWDAYSAGGSNNAVHTATGITVAADDTYDFSIRANGKNGSSSAYYIVAHMFAWVRTA